MVQVGSCTSTSRKVFSVALNQNECSIATPRSNSACTFGSQDVGKVTLPSCSAPLAGSAVESTAKNTKATTDVLMMASLIQMVSGFYAILPDCDSF